MITETSTDLDLWTPEEWSELQAFTKSEMLMVVFPMNDQLNATGE